jgi:heme-degrading monooxygenase HmoA
MAVEIIITRKIVAEKAQEIAPLMVKLRSLAQVQPGYMSSESLRRIDPPGQDEYLIRSTWKSEQDWNQWRHSTDRAVIQAKIDAITGVDTEYRVYEPLIGGIIPK